jgi:hypothetical protein
VSDMHDALNDLAKRGTPRGFDHVLASAAAQAAESGATDETANNETDDGDLHTVAFASLEPIRRRRRPLSSMIAAAGIASLLLVGSFAISAFVGDGGANSAEGAVRRLADALSHEDTLAAADVLAPSEVRSLHGTLDAAARKAKELELVQTAGAPLMGVDFDVAGLKLSSESLGDGYAKVTIDTGTFTASTNKSQFSPLMQRILRTTDNKSSSSDLAKLAADQDLPTFVVAVRESGRWYVSTAYTVLEYVRESQHLPAADFGSGARVISTLGADTPDAAVQDSMRALQRSDWSKLMTMVSPSEIPFYDYRDAFDVLIKRSANDDTPNDPFTIDSMTTTAHVDGDTAKVALTAAGRTKHGTWSLDGGCYKATDASQGAYVRQLEYPLTCGPAGPAYFSIVAFPLTGADSGSQFTVVRHGGRWFVSPVGTVLDLVDQTISVLDRRMVYSMLNIPDQIPPDGVLTLGTPVVVSMKTRGDLVLSFDGRQGEELLGLATRAQSKPVTADDVPASARVFGPDGSELADAGGLLTGHALKLPTDGTYKFVLGMQITGNDASDVTVTVWDAADAPAEAKKDRGFSSCDYTFFGASCMSTSVGPVGPTPTYTASSGAETCTSTPTEMSCSSVTTATGGSVPVTTPAGSAPLTSVGPAITATAGTTAPHG